MHPSAVPCATRVTAGVAVVATLGVSWPVQRVGLATGRLVAGLARPAGRT